MLDAFQKKTFVKDENIITQVPSPPTTCLRAKCRLLRPGSKIQRALSAARWYAWHRRQCWRQPEYWSREQHCDCQRHRATNDADVTTLDWVLRDGLDRDGWHVTGRGTTATTTTSLTLVTLTSGSASLLVSPAPIPLLPEHLSASAVPGLESSGLAGPRIMIIRA